jgi:hypothetical protein
VNTGNDMQLHTLTPHDVHSRESFYNGKKFKYTSKYTFKYTPKYMSKYVHKKTLVYDPKVSIN